MEKKRRRPMKRYLLSHSSNHKNIVVPVVIAVVRLAAVFVLVDNIGLGFVVAAVELAPHGTVSSEVMAALRNVR